MGFLNVVKDIATSFAHNVEKRAAEIRASEEKLGQYEDDRLLKIVRDDGGFFGHSSSDRAIAAKLLRQRGYGPEAFRKS